MAIQGFGNVGSHAAKFLHESAFPVVAVSDMSGAYYDPNGLNVPELLRHAMQNGGTLEGYKAATKIGGQELLTLDVDMLIPAALGDVINVENAPLLKTKLIIEAANGPVAPDADHILNERKILVLPIFSPMLVV